MIGGMTQGQNVAQATATAGRTIGAADLLRLIGYDPSNNMGAGMAAALLESYWSR